MSINNPRNPLKSSGSSSSGELLDIYSTEERRIGTWIDGKPLYRRVIQGNTGSVNLQWSGIVNSKIENIDTLVNLYASLKRENRMRYIIPYADGLAYASIAYSETTLSEVNGPFEGINLYVKGSAFLNSPVIATILYTKTTDQTEG